MNDVPHTMHDQMAAIFKDRAHKMRVDAARERKNAAAARAAAVPAGNNVVSMANYLQTNSADHDSWNPLVNSNS